MPSSLIKGQALYSILRRGFATCREGGDYGMPRRVYQIEVQGDIEQVGYSSSAYPKEKKELAKVEALELCQVYRKDWLALAPLCE